jgi:probable phosphoglycerate mutase
MRHAEEISIAVAARTVDGIFSSPLGRALATARVIADRIGVPITIVEELTEVHHGEFAGLTNDEIARIYPGDLERRAASKYTWRFPGGESYEDAHQRALIPLERIAQERSARPVIVAHEMLTRMLLRALLDLEPGDALSLSLPHAVVVEVSAGNPTVNEVASTHDRSR